MTDQLVDYLHDLQQQVTLAASVEGSEQGLTEAFTYYMVDILTDAGELEDADVATYQSVGARASGFSLSEDESTLWLLLADYRSDIDVQSLTRTDLDIHFRRMTAFLERARDGLWRQLEESAPSWDMAHRISNAWDQVGEIRMVLLTNSALRAPIGDAVDLNGRTVIHSVWDLDRLHKLASSGRAQEPISINLMELWGEPVASLGPEGAPGIYDTYLLMLPGELLAKIYEIHGPRLLELNVRSFLQARGKVNQGIQRTISNEPDRFLAYNNGISMTASSVEVCDLPSGGRAVAAISDLQIVNGGQTTASLHYAKVKNKADLSRVFIQAKLSVVDPDRLDDLVPKISEFANSQNKVNLADFRANDPFHVEVERLSRTIWAPGKSGTGDMTRWFYERARGQYADAYARERTPARQRQFRATHPQSQKFTKTDLAKFENTWDQLPWLVAWGAEKNFREFTLQLAKRGASFKPDQHYFERLIAKATIFRQAEKIIGSLQLGGYRAQTVTYTLAKLFHETGQTINLAAIWRTQTITPAFAHAIADLGPRVHAALFDTAGSRNISEWAKKEECWKSVLDIAWQIPTDLRPELVSSRVRTRTTSAESIGEQMNDEEVAATRDVLAVAGNTWKALSGWAKETNSLQGWQRSIAFSIGRIIGAGKVPSRKQIVQGARILEEARRLGFRALEEPSE